VGVEPTNGGFADLSLRPLGYRAKTIKLYQNLRGRIVAPSRHAYFFSPFPIRTSRKNRAASSGGVGLI
jgi:hypothetical protein